MIRVATRSLGNGTLDADEFGLAIDGVTDDTAAFTAFLAACSAQQRGGHIPAGTGPLLTGPIAITLTGDLRISCEATIMNKDGAVLSGRLLRFDGATRTYSVFWRGGRFDGNSGGWSLLQADFCDEVQIEIDEAFGLLGNVSSSGSTASITVLDSNDVVIRPGYIHDQAQGGATAQGSVPRALSLGNNTTTLVEGGLFKDIHCGIVTSGNQTVTITGTVLENLFDNGLYAVHTGTDRYSDGAVTMFGCHLNGTGDEPIVHNFSGTVVFQGGSISGFANAIGVQDAGMLCIDSSRIVARGPGGAAPGPGNVIKTRTGNTTSAGVSIRNCYIEAEVLNSAFAFIVGTITYFEFENNRFHWIHNSANNTSNLILQWTTGARFEFNNNVCEFTDATADIIAGNWSLQFPSVLTALSSFNNNRLINNTGTGGALFRASNIRQQLVTRNGPLLEVAGAQSEAPINVFDLTRAEPGVMWGTSVPTVGYHSVGHMVRSIGPAQWGAAGWYCYDSGTPGSWREYGYAPTILRGSGSYTIGSLAAGATSAGFIIAVTGATTADVVVGVNISYGQAELSIHAHISSFGQVTFYVENHGVGAFNVNDAAHANGPVTITALVARAS